jgi:chromosome segregation ATPase
MSLETFTPWGVPSGLILLVAFLARTQFEEIKASILSLASQLKDLNETVGGHAQKLSNFEARIDSVEREISLLRERRHRR